MSDCLQYKLPSGKFLPSGSCKRCLVNNVTTFKMHFEPEILVLEFGLEFKNGNLSEPAANVVV